MGRMDVVFGGEASFGEWLRPINRAGYGAGIIYERECKRCWKAEGRGTLW